MAPTGTIAQVILSVTLGFQQLLSAIGVDLHLVPKEPIGKQLRKQVKN